MQVINNEFNLVYLQYQMHKSFQASSWQGAKERKSYRKGIPNLFWKYSVEKIDLWSSSV